jgi:hypothetical protein
MDESTWLTCPDPRPMLDFLAGPGAVLAPPGKPRERKYRLFALACCRRIEHIFPEDDAYSRMLRVVERYTDGQATEEELRAASWGPGDDPASQAVAATLFDQDTPENEAAYIADRVLGAVHEDLADRLTIAGSDADASDAALEAVAEEERIAQADLLREVFGNPFRPVTIAPACLAWNERTIPKLAQAIYEEGAFDRLPILADALEEAGCTDPALLEHCRRSGGHCRGCWVVDVCR